MPQIRKLLYLIALTHLAAFVLPHPAGAEQSSPALLYIFAGQSNMVGAATNTAELHRVDASLHASPVNVQFWGPTPDVPRQWGPTEPPTETRETISGMGFGPEISAAPRLAALHPGATIGLVKVARGTTNLHHSWSPRNPLGMYRRLLIEVGAARERLQDATRRPVRVAGFFWMQGESDTASKRVADSYAANLTNFIKAVRTDLRTPNLPFVIGEIRDFGRYYRAFPHCSVVQRAQREVAKRVHHTHFVSTSGLQLAPHSPIHFSTRGTVDLGRRLVSSRFGL